MKLEAMSAKTRTRIGFWNVRTMYETGKLAQVTTEMRRYNLHVLGVSESRWIGTGRLKAVSGKWKMAEIPSGCRGEERS